jgi:hypothetical protein
MYTVHPYNQQASHHTAPPPLSDIHKHTHTHSHVPPEVLRVAQAGAQDLLHVEGDLRLHLILADLEEHVEELHLCKCVCVITYKCESISFLLLV